jgi:hypothetical protein
MNHKSDNVGLSWSRSMERLSGFMTQWLAPPRRSPLSRKDEREAIHGHGILETRLGFVAGVRIRFF